MNYNDWASFKVVLKRLVEQAATIQEEPSIEDLYAVWITLKDLNQILTSIEGFNPPPF